MTALTSHMETHMGRSTKIVLGAAMMTWPFALLLAYAAYHDPALVFGTLAVVGSLWAGHALLTNATHDQS